MAGLTNNSELVALDAVAGNGTPATLYIALWIGDPGEDGSGGAEVTGTDYARVAKTNNSTNFPAASSGRKYIGTDVDFGTAGSGGWGTPTHLAVMEHSTGNTSNMRYSLALTNSQAISAGNPVTVTANTSYLSLD